jgi:hypothetical protein
MMMNTSLALFAFVLVIYLIIARLRKALRPPFIALELASSEKHATNVLMQWKPNGVQRAMATVFIDIVVVLVYLAAGELLLFALQPENSPSGIVWTHGVMMIGVALIAVANGVENILLLITLIRTKPGGRAFATRVLGWFKFTMVAVGVLYLIFRGEVHLFEKLDGIVRSGDWEPIWWLSAAILLLAFVVTRRLAVFSQQYPPLLSLQLASDRLNAKGILERWGKRGRRQAGITLVLQSALALLYGITLATLCRRISVDEPVLQKAGRCAAWLVIIAASCHFAQNLGAFIAVQRGQMDWWVDAMRRLGKARMYLLGLVGLYAVALLVWVEWGALNSAAAWLTERVADRFAELPWRV